jgi:hypothetical protein
MRAWRKRGGFGVVGIAGYGCTEGGRQYNEPRAVRFTDDASSVQDADRGSSIRFKLASIYRRWRIEFQTSEFMILTSPV